MSIPGATRYVFERPEAEAPDDMSPVLVKIDGQWYVGRQDADGTWWVDTPYTKSRMHLAVECWIPLPLTMKRPFGEALLERRK